MKQTIASVEIFAHRNRVVPGGSGKKEVEVRRLTLVISAPVRATDGSGWICRVALADLERPQELMAPDSITALGRAYARGRGWLEALETSGWSLFRDRAGQLPLVLD